MDIYAAALSADGRRLVTAGKDKMARIWDLSNLSAEPIVFADTRVRSTPWGWAPTAADWSPPAETGQCGCGTSTSMS